MSLDAACPLVFAVFGFVIMGVSRVLPAISPGRAPTSSLRRIDVRIVLFWIGAGMLVAALLIGLIGVEADILRAVIVIGVTLGASAIWGVVQALKSAAQK